MMRHMEITIAHRSFRFYLYDGRVAVNVKYHDSPEPSYPEAQTIWQNLDDDTRWKLRERAFTETQEWWWEQLKEALPDYTIGCHGRSGGYVVFEDWTDGKLEDLAYDALSTACELCGDGDPATPDKHISAVQMFQSHTWPLQFPDAPWDLKCRHCADYYHQHWHTRCPFMLGVKYETHEYVGYELQQIERVAAAVTKVEEYATRSFIKPALDDYLDSEILRYWEDRNEYLSKDGTAHGP